MHARLIDSGCLLDFRQDVCKAVWTEAAEFLGCKEIQEDIIKHLKTLLVETTKRSETISVASGQLMVSDEELSPLMQCGYSRDWHTVQVWPCISLLHLQCPL
jgi:hypothetical protein